MIKTFEELFEEVKKLYPTKPLKYDNKEKYYLIEFKKAFKKFNAISFHFKQKRYAISTKQGNFIYNHKFYDNPNKILKLIKAIKECEDEQNRKKKL